MVTQFLSNLHFYSVKLSSLHLISVLVFVLFYYRHSLSLPFTYTPSDFLLFPLFTSLYGRQRITHRLSEVGYFGGPSRRLTSCVEGGDGSRRKGLSVGVPEKSNVSSR